MVQYWLSIFSGDNGFITSFLLNWVMLFFFQQVNLKKNIAGTNMESGKDHQVGTAMTPISEAVSWALPLLPLTAAYLSLLSPPLPLPSLSVTLQSTTQSLHSIWDILTCGLVTHFKSLFIFPHRQVERLLKGSLCHYSVLLSELQHSSNPAKTI